MCSSSHPAGDSVVDLRVCLSDIKRFDSFPRHGVVVTVYGIGRIGKKEQEREDICVDYVIAASFVYCVFSLVCVSILSLFVIIST